MAREFVFVQNNNHKVVFQETLLGEKTQLWGSEHSLHSSQAKGGKETKIYLFKGELACWGCVLSDCHLTLQLKRGLHITWYWYRVFWIIWEPAWVGQLINVFEHPLVELVLYLSKSIIIVFNLNDVCRMYSFMKYIYTIVTWNRLWIIFPDIYWSFSTIILWLFSELEFIFLNDHPSTVN